MASSRGLDPPGHRHQAQHPQHHQAPTTTRPPAAITLEAAVKNSRAIWIRDLRALHDHAKERFADVKWTDGVDEAAGLIDGLEGEDGVGLGIVAIDENALEGGEDIYAHKAILYARAPKGFKDRYFTVASTSPNPSRHLTSSPNPSFLSSPPDPHNTSQPNLSLPSPSFAGPSPSPHPAAGPSSRPYLSIDPYASSSHSGPHHIQRSKSPLTGRTISGDGPSTSLLELDHKGTPELVRAHLEWLYTSEGMGGDVVEWLNAENGEGAEVWSSDEKRGGGELVGLGFDGVGLESQKKLRRLSKIGDEAERHDKLAQDLVYMWRSKLYADIKIRLQVNTSKASAHSHTPPISFRGQKTRSRKEHSDGRSSAATSYVEDSDVEADAPSARSPNVMAFSAHRFLLCSRSPYFAQVLLNSGAFAYHPATSSVSLNKDHIPEILLPTPPFTPIALHFVLGYLYSGSLSFSHRTFDLNTAFAVYRAAIFLEIDPLLTEVEARIIWDFCDGMSTTSNSAVVDSARKKCARRVPRVWRFAMMPDVGALALSTRASTYIIHFWGECLGKEVALADGPARDRLLEQIVEGISKHTIVPGYSSLVTVSQKFSADSDGDKSTDAKGWEADVRDMLDVIVEHLQSCLVGEFVEIVDQPDFSKLLDPDVFQKELLQKVLRSLAEGTGRPDLCEKAPQVYQAIVHSLLTGTAPDSDELILPPGSSVRQAVESTKEEVLRNIKKRWMQIRPTRSFNSLEFWALKEISDEIDVEIQDLLEPERRSSRLSTRSLASVTSQPAVKERTPLPRTTTRQSLAPTRSGADAAARSRVASGSSRLPASASAPAPGTAAAFARRPLPRTPATPPMPAPSTPKAGRSNAPVASGSRTPVRPAAGRPAQPSTPGGKASPATNSASPRDDAASVRTVGTGRTRLDSSNPKGSPRPGTTRPAVAGSSRPSPPAGVAVAAARVKAATGSPAAGLSPALSEAARAARERSTSMRSTASSVTPSVASPLRSAGTTAMARAPHALPRRLTDETASLRSQAGANLAAKKAKEAAAGPSPVLGTATSRAREALAQKTKAAQEESDAKSLRAASVKSGATNRTTIVGPKTPTTSSTPKMPPTPADKPSTSNRLTRNLAKEPSVSSLKTLRLKPTTKAGSSGLAPAVRPKAVSDAAAKSKAAKLAMEKAPFPSPPRTSSKQARVPSKPLKEASASTDGNESETVTPVQSDTEGLPGPMIVRQGSGGSDNGFGPPLEDIIKRKPADLGLAKSSFRPPLPSETGSYDQVSIRQRATSAASSTYLKPHPAHAFDPPTRALDSPMIRVTDDTIPPEPGSGAEIKVGIPCIVSLGERKARFKALCRYIGRVEGKPGPWVGVEIADYVGIKYNLDGLGDGSVDGVRYFELTAPDLLRRDVDAGPGGMPRRPSDTIRPGSRRAVGRKASMPTGTVRGYRYDDGPLSASFTESFEHGSSISRSGSPAPGSEADYGQPSNWIQGAFGPANGRTKGLFVTPSEVVFVLGAGE